MQDHEDNAVPRAADVSDAPRTRRIQRNMIAAVTSGFVGFLALASSMYTVYLQRQQVRASVWPRIDSREETAENDYKSYIVNRGAGSAVIKRVRVFLDGKPMKSWGDFFQQAAPGKRYLLSHAADLRGTLNPAGEKLFLEMDWRALLVVAEVGHRGRLEICYCSSLDECWNTGGDFGAGDDVDPSPAKDCAPDPIPFQTFTEEERHGGIESVREWVNAHTDAEGRMLVDAGGGG